jgi:hypothetical protein
LEERIDCHLVGIKPLVSIGVVHTKVISTCINDQAPNKIKSEDRESAEALARGDYDDRSRLNHHSGN